MSAHGIRARLVGTFHAPRIHVTLARNAHTHNGKPALVWVKGLPDRVWDPALLCWWVTGLGPHPGQVLRHAGIDLDTSEAPVGNADPADVSAVLAELTNPVVRADSANPNGVLIRPRLAGPTHVSTVLVPMAENDPETGRMSADLLDLVDPATGAIRAGLNLDADVAGRAQHAWRTRVLDVRAGRDRRVVRAARLAGLSPSFTRSGVEGRDDAEVAGGPDSALAVLTKATGGVPVWFGLDLYEYQQLGVHAALAGRSLVADSPGAGKTRQALAAAAAVLERERAHVERRRRATGAGIGAVTGRTVIVVPPVVLTHWARETVRSHLGVPDPTSKSAWWPRDVLPADGSPAADRVPADVVVVQPGRRMPGLPERGVLIVADSILASRPTLVDEIVSWSPSVVVYDEAHRARTWTSTRSQTIRGLITRIRDTRTAHLGSSWGGDPETGVASLPALTALPLTGTPMFTGSPVEMIPLLAMSGHLDWVFGGRAAFAERFCRRDHFGRWVGRTKHMDELRRLLDIHVWVRRHKADILPWLPEKRWVTSYVDVAMADIRAAQSHLDEIVDAWLDDQAPHEPDEAEVEEWCRAQIGLLSPLRKSTGLAKVPAAVEHLETWLAGNLPRPDATGAWTFEEPLVLWAHHREVISALADHARDLLEAKLGTSLPPVAVIDGSTSLDRRTEYVDALQAKHLGVLVCQITAAGVGLTLTACANPVFVESDWTAQLMSQAEDRHHRPGQDRGVTLTALCATGTLDEHVLKVRNTKEDVASLVVGDRAGRATRDNDHDTSSAFAPWELLAEVVQRVQQARHRPRRSRRAA
ncbi:MAG TPA: DEAD/DEAH box helicase [Nakamurella sp.]